jgi:DNA-binding transcriptional ArsR family regulator
MDRKTADVDDAVDVLTSPDRRRVLEYLDDESVESTTVTGLASHLASLESGSTSQSRDERSYETRLHHIHLPKLDDHGILEYDPRSNAVRYRPNARVEEMLDRLQIEI